MEAYRSVIMEVSRDRFIAAELLSYKDVLFEEATEEWYVQHDLVKMYVTAMKTVKQCNMMKREMKLAIGDELQTLFHPIVNATKQAAEETRKELEPMKKTLADIDGALKPVAAPQPGKNVDTTFGIYRRKDGQLQMGSEIVGVNENTSIVCDTEYDLTQGLWAFIMQKHPQVSQWPSRDY